MVKKSKPAKKAASKKAPVKKAAAKKTAVKRTAIKSAAKKAPVKKAVAKKQTVKKTVSKKIVTKKAAAKKAVKKRPAVKKVVLKKPEPLKLVKRLKSPAVPVLAVPGDMLAKTANVTNVKSQMMEPGDAINEPADSIDPLWAFDKHAADKATAKGDPHNRLRLSSNGKGSIKPSGKKPLWRR